MPKYYKSAGLYFSCAYRDLWPRSNFPFLSFLVILHLSEHNTILNRKCWLHAIWSNTQMGSLLIPCADQNLWKKVGRLPSVVCPFQISVLKKVLKGKLHSSTFYLDVQCFTIRSMLFVPKFGYISIKTSSKSRALSQKRTHVLYWAVTRNLIHVLLFFSFVSA